MSDLKELMKSINYNFRDTSLLERALTHSSYANERKNPIPSNERLEFLGDSVLRIASFTPTYWFVNANNRIAELTQFNFSNIEPILSCMLIQLGFALAFFTTALVISKKRRFE